ncbi:MAG: hypothetical protein Q8O30_01390 [Candidatus Omnitrophota bacterium]|nr:hypothetical protein [Candidatus Omnitrophota bacterium]
MIKILPTFDPIFRSERKESEKQVETYFSNEEKNDTAGNGSYKIELLNKDNQEGVGTITYDYDLIGETPMIKIRTVGVSLEYQRQDFSMQLYHRLLDLVKEKSLAGIRSDEIVQGGALASWKKLQEQGFNVSIYPELLNKYKEFCKAYDEGKYFKDQLATNNGESVFTINLE